MSILKTATHIFVVWSESLSRRARYMCSILKMKNVFLCVVLINLATSLALMAQTQSPNSGNTYTTTMTISGTFFVGPFLDGSGVKYPNTRDFLPAINVEGHNLVPGQVYDFSADDYGSEMTWGTSQWSWRDVLSPPATYTLTADSEGNAIGSNSPLIEGGFNYKNIPAGGVTMSAGGFRQIVVRLKKNNVVLDTAYVRANSSGSVFAKTAISSWWDLSASGNDVTVHLYGVLNTLIVRFSILDEGSKEAPAGVRIGGKYHSLGYTFPSLPGRERNYNLAVTERMEGPLTSKLVEVMVGESVIRGKAAPAEFPNNRYTMDFGLIHLKGDCKACQNGMCTAGSMAANLGGSRN